MDVPRQYYASKKNESDKERQILYDITYMWNFKNNTNESIYCTKQKQTHRYRKQTFGYQGKERQGDIN